MDVINRVYARKNTYAVIVVVLQTLVDVVSLVLMNAQFDPLNEIVASIEAMDPKRTDEHLLHLMIKIQTTYMTYSLAMFFQSLSVVFRPIALFMFVKEFRSSHTCNAYYFSVAFGMFGYMGLFANAVGVRNAILLHLHHTNIQLQNMILQVVLNMFPILSCATTQAVPVLFLCCGLCVFVN